jgi:hypothetical protein
MRLNIPRLAGNGVSMKSTLTLLFAATFLLASSAIATIRLPKASQDRPAQPEKEREAALHVPPGLRCSWLRGSGHRQAMNLAFDSRGRCG